jgi:hypothetical protein
MSKPSVRWTSRTCHREAHFKDGAPAIWGKGVMHRIQLLDFKVGIASHPTPRSIDEKIEARPLRNLPKS